MFARERNEAFALARLAAPLAAAHAGLQLMGVVDAAVVGRLGATQLGAIGIANALFFFFAILGTGIVMGVDPLTAQALGAGNLLLARRMMWQGVWLASLLGILLSLPMFVSPALLPRIGVEPAVTVAAASYLGIRTLSLLPMLVYFVIRSYLQARLLMRPIVLSIVVANVFNLVADVLLVHGGTVLPAWCGPLRSIPAYGIAGAAVASVIATLVQVAIVADGVRRIGATFDEPHRALVSGEFGKAFRVGLPTGLHMTAEVGIFALVGLVAGTLGEIDLAAHQIALTLAAMSFTVVVGIGVAGSVRVGRAIGARNSGEVRLAGLVAFAAGALFMLGAASLFWLFPEVLASLFTNDPRIIALSGPLLAVAAFFQISDGIQGVGAGVLRGAGDTRFTFVANLVGHWLIGLPTALYLAFRLEMGIVGLWWGLCAGLTAVAALLFVRFIRLSSVEIRPLID